jgi:hypothetical protein
VITILVYFGVIWYIFYRFGLKIWQPRISSEEDFDMETAEPEQLQQEIGKQQKHGSKYSVSFSKQMFFSVQNRAREFTATSSLTLWLRRPR